MARLPAACIAGLLGLAHAAAGTQEVGLEVGTPFPDIVLPALDDGRPVSLADFRGKKVVLQIFASW